MKLSIITVNLNNAHGLLKTIQSVICQKFKDYEFLIIDGKSSDSSLSIIKEYDKYISRWVSESDSGIYNAMNKGIRMAHGEYLLFMNSGDVIFSEDTLEKVFEKDYCSDYIFGSSLLKCNRCTIKRIIPKQISFYYLYTYTLWHQSMFIKKDVFERYGYYDENLKITSDWKQYIIALFKYNCSYSIISDFISINDYDGISSLKNNTLSIILKERQVTLEQYFPGFIEDYRTLHRFKKFTLRGIIRGIKRRYTEFLCRL